MKRITQFLLLAVLVLWTSAAFAFEQFFNGVVTTLNGGINNAVTSIVLTSATGLNWTAGGTFRVLIDSEIMLGTALSGTTATVTRAQEGTTAASHSNGAVVTIVLTSGAIAQLTTDIEAVAANASNITSGTLATARLTGQGNGSKVQLATGTTTNNNLLKYDANGNAVDSGVSTAGTVTNPMTAALSFSTDTSGVNTQLTNANTAGWLDPAAFGASYSTATASATATASNAALSGMGANDFVAPEGVFIPHGGTACSINSTACSSITVTAPTVELGTCSNIQQATPYSASNWQDDIGVFYTRNMERLENHSSPIVTQYAVSSGSYSWNTTDNYQPLTICYALTVAHYPSGSHSIAVKVAALDANDGMTAASAATTVSSVSMTFPTPSLPVLIYEGTPVTNASGYAFWESIDSGAYFLARVVWTNDISIDEGAAATNKGTGYVEWGSSTSAAEDIPATPPGSALNDDLLADKIVSKSGNNITLTTAPSVSGSVTVKHDDEPAWADTLTYCASLVRTDCRIQVKPAVTRLSSLSIPAGIADLAIEGQDVNGSRMQFFGNGGASVCNNANSTGGQFTDILGNNGLHLRHLNIQSTNSAADCIFQGYSNHWLPLEVYDTAFTGAPNHYGMMYGDGGGHIDGIFNGFLEDIDLAGSANGVWLGGYYSASYQVWPGMLLYPMVGYNGGDANDTFDTFVFENPWNAVGPDGLNGAAGGGYVQGLKINNSYLNDISDQGCAGLSNCIGGDVTQQGTEFVLNTNNGTVDTDSAGGGAAVGLGFAWVQAYIANAVAVIKNNSFNGGAFGIVADGQLDAEDNQFLYIGTNKVGIAADYAGSTIVDNKVVGNGASGNTGYLIGYTSNLSTQGCVTGDPFYVRFGTSSAYGGSLATLFNACSTTSIEPGFRWNAQTQTCSGSGGTNCSSLTFRPTVNTQNTNWDITMTGADTITLGSPYYAGQAETFKVCQNSGGSHTPTFATSGPTITGTYPTCTTTASKCCSFQVIFDTATTGYMPGPPGNGPL